MFTRETYKISKRHSEIHENLQVTFIIFEKSYLHPYKIYKICTNHQEKLNIIQIQCLHSGINSLKYNNTYQIL